MAMMALVLLTGFVSSDVQAQGLPCDCARRWTGGGHWNTDGTINDLPNAPAAFGIIRCASAAETQSQIEPYSAQCVWNSAAAEAAGIELPAFTANGPCFDPSGGFADEDANEVSLPNVLTEVIGPTDGQPIIWLNFDVRAYASSFSFQINDNSGDNIGWALYESTISTDYVEFNAATNDSLSGDCGELVLVGFSSPTNPGAVYTEKWCGSESSNTWSTPTSPQSFNPLQPSNFYLLIWDQDADGNLAINNFKARFGCSDPTICFLELNGSPTVNCASAQGGATYSVEIPIIGNNGQYVGYDPNATPQYSDPVCLTSLATTGVIEGTIVMTYPVGVPYNVTISAQSPSSDPNCATPDNAVQCVQTVSGPSPAPPQANAEGGTLTCIVTSVQLQANECTPIAGLSYEWSGPAGYSSTEQCPTVSAIGTYTVTVTSDDGCTATATAVVTENVTPPNASATGGNLTCVVTCLDVVASSTTPGATFQWTGGPATASWERCDPGTYTVTVTNPVNGCTATATAVVTENVTAPEVTANGGMIPCDQTCIVISASSTTDGVSYAWSGPDGFSQDGAEVEVCAAGIYTVTVTDSNNGCTSTATAEVTLEEPCDCQLRTQTMGGWGAPPKGNNPGMYLHNNFALAFPSGIVIGALPGDCLGARRLELTSAQAVTNFLPSGGQPTILPPGVTINPTVYGNTFAGQLTALTISVGLDAAIPDFGESNTLLGETYVVSGLFAGMQVNEILELANLKIGNCGGSYSNSQLSGVLGAINENFVGGTIDNGFLSCTPPIGAKNFEPAVDAKDELIAFPNPTRDNLTVRTLFAGEGKVTIDLIDLSGRRVAGVDGFLVNAGDLRVNDIDLSNLESGVYLLTVVRDGVVMTERIVVAK